MCLLLLVLLLSLLVLVLLLRGAVHPGIVHGESASTYGGSIRQIPTRLRSVLSVRLIHACVAGRAADGRMRMRRTSFGVSPPQTPSVFCSDVWQRGRASDSDATGEQMGFVPLGGTR